MRPDSVFHGSVWDLSAALGLQHPTPKTCKCGEYLTDLKLIAQNKIPLQEKCEVKTGGDENFWK